MNDTDGSRPDTTSPSSRSSTLSAAEFEAKSLEIASSLMGAALRLTRRRADADDLVQETLYRAYRSLASFRKGTRFRAWMFRILHNVFINRSRREKLAPTAVDPAQIQVADPEHGAQDLFDLAELPALADEHFDEQVKVAVDELPEVYRVPLLLFALGDQRYSEIADTLGIPIGTVMSRLHRGRRLLKERLGEYARSLRFPAGERDG